MGRSISWRCCTWHVEDIVTCPPLHLLTTNYGCPQYARHIYFVRRAHTLVVLPAPRLKHLGCFNWYSRHLLHFWHWGCHNTLFYHVLPFCSYSDLNLKLLWEPISHAFLSRPPKQAVPSQAPDVRVPEFGCRETYFLRRIDLNHSTHLLNSFEGRIDGYKTRLGSLWVASCDFLSAFPLINWLRCAGLALCAVVCKTPGLCISFNFYFHAVFHFEFRWYGVFHKIGLYYFRRPTTYIVL